MTSEHLHQGTSAPDGSPSDICIVLATLHGAYGEWVSADEIRGQLAILGFACSTQQVAAWLRRVCAFDAPPIEARDEGLGFREYRVTCFGETWLHNVLPHIWWAQQRARDRLCADMAAADPTVGGLSVMCVACDLGHPEACANQAPVYMPPKCCNCGRFVDMETAHEHLEQGDYGTVYSVEYECPRCAASDEEQR